MDIAFGGRKPESRAARSPSLCLCVSVVIHFLKCWGVRATLSQGGRLGQNGAMTDKPVAAKPPSDAEERRRRQAEALKANLARRKSQARARAEVDPAPPPADEPEKGG